jgi:hypothetical protein
VTATAIRFLFMAIPCLLGRVLPPGDRRPLWAG